MEKMLAADVRLGLALPWRISVFTENGATRIGLIRPARCWLRFLSVPRVAAGRELEEKTIQIVDETR